MAGTEHGILQALGGSLLGAMVINTECFLEEYDSDVQQQQRSVGSLVNVSPDKVAFKVSNSSNGHKIHCGGSLCAAALEDDHLGRDMNTTHLTY